MSRPSSIDRLSPELRAQLNELLARPDVTQQEITDLLNAEGAGVSKSAVNRYAVRMRKWADRNRQTRQIVESYLAQCGQEGQENLSEVLVQQLRDLAHGLLVRMQDMHDDSEEVEEEDRSERAAEIGKLLSQAARSVRDIEMAADRSTERRRKLRAEVAKEAADAAGAAATNAGVSPETIAVIQRDVLGVGR